jgi:hypothetical protein
MRKLLVLMFVALAIWVGLNWNKYFANHLTEPQYVDVGIDRKTFMEVYASLPSDLRTQPFTVRVINAHGKMSEGVVRPIGENDRRRNPDFWIGASVDSPGDLIDGFTIEIVPPNGEQYKEIFVGLKPRHVSCVYFEYSRVNGKTKFRIEREADMKIGCPLSIRA